MRIYDEDKPLIFIHVPKAAGSSVRKTFGQWFGRKLYRHYFDERRDRLPKRHRLVRLLDGRRFRSRICIFGHFNRDRGFGLEQYYPEVDQFMTVLRDPFERVVSDYFYARKEGTRRGGRFRSGQTARIEDNFADLADFLKRADSQTLKHLPVGLTTSNFREVLEDQFVYIGVVSDLQASIDAMALRLGKPAVGVPHRKVSPRDERIPDELRREFEERHPLECQIYEYAVQAHARLQGEVAAVRR